MRKCSDFLEQWCGQFIVQFSLPFSVISVLRSAEKSLCRLFIRDTDTLRAHPAGLESSSRICHTLFNSHSQIQDTMSFFSVANWVQLMSKGVHLAGWCSCALWGVVVTCVIVLLENYFKLSTRPPNPVTQRGIRECFWVYCQFEKFLLNTGPPDQSTSDSRYRFGFTGTVTIVQEKRTIWCLQSFAHLSSSDVRKGRIFLSVNVDDIKLAGKKQNINLTWKVLMEDVDLGEPTSFLDHVYLGCTQRECQISKNIVDKYRSMFESRISAGTKEKLPETKATGKLDAETNIFLVLRHGRSCEEMRGKILRTCE